MRFTVRGTKHGMPVEISWDEGVVDGDPEVMNALLERATPRVGRPGVVRPPIHQAGIVIAGLTEPIPFLQAVQRTLDDIDEIDTSDGREPMRMLGSRLVDEGPTMHQARTATS